jgi:thiamine-phosphate pyrophosphorylase
VKRIGDCFLYGIVDLGYVLDRNVGLVTSQLVAGGIDVVQVRAKGRSKPEITDLVLAMLPITKAAGVPLIVNDHPDLLQDVAADGCHVGQEDFGVAEARALAGRPCIVGKSTHSLEQAASAQQEGADYIGFGPLFPTATKPSAVAVGLDQLAALRRTINLPVFCIGGVKLENLREVVHAGARRVCMVSDLVCASDVQAHTAAVKVLLRELGAGARGREGVRIHHRGAESTKTGTDLDLASE